jgi:hypothetical protein
MRPYVMVRLPGDAGYLKAASGLYTFAKLAEDLTSALDITLQVNGICESAIHDIIVKPSGFDPILSFYSLLFIFSTSCNDYFCTYV